MAVKVAPPRPGRHVERVSASLAAFVRRHDPDRFFTALFAPAAARETLFVLYAFNHELARAREAVTEPSLALIRLQWWREVVAGAPRRHEVAEPLATAIEAGSLPRDGLLRLVDAREIETDPAIPSLAAWLDYVRGTAGELAVIAARSLGAPAPERIRDAGAAYGVAGLLRSVPAHARQGRCLLPTDVLERHGLTPEAVIGQSGCAGLGSVRNTLAEIGLGLAGGPGALALSRAARAAALPVVLARRDLRRTDCLVGPRGLPDLLAVALAVVSGRI